MNLLRRLFAPQPDPRDALRPLWQVVVAEARRPEWYRAGAADTETTNILRSGPPRIAG